MSRIGKLPVEIPSGVKVSLAGGEILIEGPKGKLSHPIPSLITVKEEEGNVWVNTDSNAKQAQADFGTTRAIINNMVKGVAEGWQRKLILSGVGFTAKLSGDKLELATGYSHKTTVTIPQGISCKAQKTEIELESCDKQAVGQIAAKIRKVCPPEPYLGKGIRYSDEQIRRKAGKTGK